MGAYYQSSSYNTGSSVVEDAPAMSSQSSHPSAVPGDVSTAVKNLLTSTKRLQEVLRLWSIQDATEGDVSDLYVQIGNEFNVVVNSFAYHQIELNDLHDIPAELRTVLEHCLSEDPSPTVLETFTPDLRKVLFRLLKGLQSRQGLWRTAVERHGGSTNSLDSE